MKRILINETEKNEILNQHKDFKKILEEKKMKMRLNQNMRNTHSKMRLRFLKVI